MADEKQSTEFEAAVQQMKQYVDPFNPQNSLWHDGSDGLGIGYKQELKYEE